MPQENQPIVVVAKWMAGPRAIVADGRRDELQTQIEKQVRDARTGLDLAAQATSSIEKLLLDEKPAPHSAGLIAPDDNDHERFPYERDCQKIVLAFAKKHFGYDHVNRPRFTFPRLVDLTLRHGCSVLRDTIKAILEEADPCSRPSGRRPNRNRSYHKFIYALAHEFCANDDGRLSAKAAEKICRIVREQGDTVTVEAVGEILKDMGRAVKPNW